MAATDDADALLAAVEERGRIAFDGMAVEHNDEGFEVRTPGLERIGLDGDAVRDVLETVDEYVTNWRYWQETVDGEGTARRSFLRWCERAPLENATADESAADADDVIGTVPDRYEALREGIDRRWGQLCVTARLVDADEPRGERVYDLWHRDDAGHDVSELEVFDDPRAARELATEDGDGRYRPLKTAPTLVPGWAFTGLSGEELVETVDFFYPATVANWYRERRDDLDVDHWLETAERQTGIYDVVDELPRDAVEWLTEACCVDSQCLRRREWEYEDGDDLAVDGGDGQFPCREPCSLVIAAARQFAILESERDRTWELELTTSELNQLAELVDAVADDRVDEIREADVGDGANRFRARYLRAKRFDGDGFRDARKSSE